MPVYDFEQNKKKNGVYPGKALPFSMVSITRLANVVLWYDSKDVKKWGSVRALGFYPWLS